MHYTVTKDLYKVIRNDTGNLSTTKEWLSQSEVETLKSDKAVVLVESITPTTKDK
jgi:hypothetical protein